MKSRYTDDENDYWLGFIHARGITYLLPNKKQRTKVIFYDESHLLKFAKHFRTLPRSRRNHNSTNYSLVVPELCLPKLPTDRPLTIHYLRGWFDARGHVNIKDQTLTLKITGPNVYQLTQPILTILWLEVTARRYCSSTTSLTIQLTGKRALHFLTKIYGKPNYAKLWDEIRHYDTSQS